MELNDTQKEVLEKLASFGLGREDIFSIMLMLTKEAKARDFLARIQEKKTCEAEELRRLCAEVAFRDTENAEKI